MADATRELLIEIKGKTDHFNQKFKETQTKAQKLKQQFMDLAKVVAGAYVAGRIINAFKGIIKETINLGVELRKLSDTLDIGVVPIQRIQYAAGQLNVDFNKITNSLPKLSKYMAEARDGMATYKDEFDKMNISVTDSEGNLKDAYTVLLEMGDYIKKDGVVQTEKLASVMNLLGRSGADLIPFLKADRGQLELWGDAAEAMVGTLSEDMVDALVIADRNMKELTATTDGLKIQLGVGLIPIVTEYAQSLTQILGLTSDVNRESATFGETVLNIGMLLGNPIAQIKKMRDKLREVKDAQTEVYGPQPQQDVETLADIIKKLGLGGNKTSKQLSEVDRVLNALEVQGLNTKESIRQINTKFYDSYVASENFSLEIEELNTKMQGLENASSSFGSVLSDIFEEGEMRAEDFFKSLLKIGVQLALMQFTGGLGGFASSFFGGLGFGQGGMSLTHAAQGLVTTPSITNNRTIYNEYNPTIPETVLTAQELKMLIHGISNPKIEMHNFIPLEKAIVKAVVNVPHSVKSKLARALKEDVLKTQDRLR